MNSSNSKNMIDIIEQRLIQLEKEKEDIENLYGIDENILKEFTKDTQNVINATKNLTNSKLNKTHSTKQSQYDNLPKLQITKKEIKKNYKTPETIVDSLKYEPNINDLLDNEEFEPSFTNLNNLKTAPSLQKGFAINKYISYKSKYYEDNYI